LLKALRGEEYNVKSDGCKEKQSFYEIKLKLDFEG
jgi:hypothetical protein